MSNPVLLAVAHGSSHPAAAAAIGALASQVRRLAPVIDIRTAFIQHGEPSLTDGLASAGSDVVVVPLLLSTGYHLTTDIAAATGGAGTAGQADALQAAGQAREGSPREGSPREAIAAGAITLTLQGMSASNPRVAGPLGPDSLLTVALAGRLAEAGVPAGTAVVLAAAGSTDPAAEAEVRSQAAMLAAELGAEVVIAFAAAGRPTVPEAVADLRERTGGPVAVATYLLAPGQFHDRLAESGANWVSAPLGGHPAVAALVIDRYRTSNTAR